MRKNLTKAKAFSSAMILASVGVLSSTIPTASAGDTGGGGGNGVCIGTCDATTPFNWRFTSTDGSKSAWTKFAGAKMNSWGGNGIFRAYTEGEAFPGLTAHGMTNQQLLDVCKRSKTIWWITSSKPFFQGKQNAWVWNSSNKNYPQAPGGIAFNNATGILNSSMDPKLEQQAIKWITSTVPSGKITVVCSGMFDNSNTPPGTPGANPKPPVKITTKTETRTQTRSGSAQKWTQTYAYMTQISRQIAKNGKDPIGVDNLHDQNGVKTTKFAALWDDITKNPNNYKGKSPAEIKALVDQAVAADKKANHATVDLDAQNKAGLAEGGVLNINQLTRSATISAKQDIVDTQKRTCTTITDWVKDAKSGAWVVSPKKPVTSCDEWTTVSSSTSMTASTQIDATPKQTAFWQMLSVHCNKAQFEALVNNAPGAKVVDSGDASKALSAVAYSRTYTQQPALLDFGDANNTKSALKASADLGFYDKECPFECRASATAQGASAQNGATQNMGNKKPDGNGATVGRYGAVSGRNNDSKFSFFRDNVKHLISTDVWYPASNSVVKYNGAAPLSTTINRWSEGTPSLDGSDGGKFTMTTQNGKELFKGTDTPTTQKNFSTDTFSNATSEQLSGLVRAVNVQSTWASEKDKPQTFNFKWEYAPTVNTQAMATGIGFTSSDVPMGTAQTLPAAIQGKCYGVYGSNSNTIDTPKLFAANTGTGTKNNLDGGLIDGANNEKANLYVSFVRSTTE